MPDLQTTNHNSKKLLLGRYAQLTATQKSRVDVFVYRYFYYFQLCIKPTSQTFIFWGRNPNLHLHTKNHKKIGPILNLPLLFYSTFSIFYRASTCSLIYLFLESKLYAFFAYSFACFRYLSLFDNLYIHSLA